MASSCGVHAVANQLTEIHFRFLLPGFLIAGPAGAQDLFDRIGQPVDVTQHDAVELLLLWFGQFPPLQGFQMQADRGHWGLQFVSYGIDETVVLLAAAEFADEEDGIHYHTRDDESEENDPKEQQDAFAPVEDDPPDVKSDRQCHQADAQAKEEHDRSAAARNAHGVSSD